MSRPDAALRAGALASVGIRWKAMARSAVLRFLKRHEWSLPLFMAAGVLFAMLAAEIREGHMTAFDEAVALLIARWRGKLDAPMLFATRSGNFPWMAITCLAGIVGLTLAKRRREAAFVATCGASALALSTGLKLLFHRARPSPASYLIDLPSSFSFPSGHAMGSASVVGSLAVVAVVCLPRHWRWVAVALALLFIASVGASRVYFGVHYPSDVLGGQLASGAVIAAATGWFYPRLLPGEATEHPADPEL
jgi:membrane-associated phospholipid phosphatase